VERYFERCYDLQEASLRYFIVESVDVVEFE
jgi:hypothetical protein